MNEVINAISASGKRSDDTHVGEPETLRGPKPAGWTGRERATAAQRPGSEPYDALLWRLQARQAVDSSESMTLGITACERRAGTTTVVASLALRAAELQLGPVLLVEANRRGSWLSKKWKLSEGPGLSQLLASEASYVECLQAGPAPQLEVITAGSVGRGEVGVLEPGAVEALLAEACADHRIVLFDLPAADELNQMLLVAKQLDQVLMVVRSESTRKGDAERFGEQLLDDGAPLAGIVLNRQRDYIPRFLRKWL
jgi:Mrp family chromosome partitioning ATPase